MSIQLSWHFTSAGWLGHTRMIDYQSNPGGGGGGLDRLDLPLLCHLDNLAASVSPNMFTCIGLNQQAGIV